MILIGCKKDNVAYMATDTRIVFSDLKINELCEINYKISKLDNGIIYGFTGDRMLRQLIKANEEIFTLDKSGDLSVKHIVTEIVPKLFDLLNGENMLINDGNESPKYNGAFLIAFNGKLFGIGNSFYTYEIEDLYVLGWMADYALSSVESMDLSGDVESQMVKAMQVCSKNTEYVSGPYLTVNTLDKEYKIWENE